MIIYHGSEYIIENPQFGKGKKNNDYGQGFYCTEDQDLAKEWSVTSSHDGYINRYDFDDSKLSILNLNTLSVMAWLAVLLENRTFEVTAPLAKEAKEYILHEFLPDYKKYDIIIGYRADDSYFSFAEDFISGVISYEQLCEAIRLGDLGDQVVLKKQTAFDRLKFIGSEKVSKKIWFPKREERDKKARAKYFSMDKRYIKGALYITKILDEEIKKDDHRIR